MDTYMTEQSLNTKYSTDTLKVHRFIEERFEAMESLASRCEANYLLRSVKGTAGTLEDLSSSGIISTPDYNTYKQRIDKVIDKFSKKCRCYDSDKYIISTKERTGKIVKIGKATIRE